MAGVVGVHIIEGSCGEGLLSEACIDEVAGTPEHAYESQAKRDAYEDALSAIHAHSQRGAEADELLKRTRADVERMIDDYFVFEVDKNPVACGALHLYPNLKKAEIASVYVDPNHENRGIGAKLIKYAEDQARGLGFETVYCLSTQAVNFFVQKGGFQLGTPDGLPPVRRDLYDRSGRKSQVLVKRL